MNDQRVSPIPGAEAWSYGAFRHDPESRTTTVPLAREDGTSAEFAVPDFVDAPEDLRVIAMVVIRALEKWEGVQGLGA